MLDVPDRHDDASLRVAIRYRVASYFQPGEIILYGKYKNKKGRIVALSTDERGHPTIEIEPIPKGRKQNKVMGLYKIWKTPESLAGETP